MRFVDLSAPIRPSPPETPALLRTEIAFSAHDEGAQTIETMFSLPRRLLRDGEGWATEEFTRFGTHNSTHVDAPWHYNSTVAGEPAATIDELPLEWFHGPGVVLDMTAKADGDPMTAPEAEAALQAAGHPLAAGDIVLVRTGRDEHYGAPDYMARGRA